MGLNDLQMGLNDLQMGLNDLQMDLRWTSDVLPDVPQMSSQMDLNGHHGLQWPPMALMASTGPHGLQWPSWPHC